MDGPDLNPQQRQRAREVIGPRLDLLRRTALALTRNEHDADDLVQEALAKAIRAIDSFAEGTDEKAWLLTILRRAHIDRLRAAGRRVSAVSLDADSGVDVADPAANDPASSAGRHDDQWHDPEAMMQQFADADVITALRDLPPDICWTLLLVDVEGLDHEQAAAVLGIPRGTVKSRTHRGRAMLRDRLHALGRRMGWFKPEP